MRHGASGRRSRNRGNSGGRKNNQNRMQVFDSNGPDVRIRGTAHQVHEKYAALAKDAASCGDIILSESYAQHAEHYQRIINNWNQHVETDGSLLDAEIQEERDRKVQAELRRQQAAQDDSNKDGEDLGLPESVTAEAKSGNKAKSNAREDSLEDA